MSNDVYFKRDPQAFSALMKSPECIAVLESFAEQKAAEMGVGYEPDVQIGSHKANVRVKTATYEAYLDNLENNTLLKGMKV